VIDILYFFHLFFLLFVFVCFSIFVCWRYKSRTVGISYNSFVLHVFVFLISMVIFLNLYRLLVYGFHFTPALFSFVCCVFLLILLWTSRCFDFNFDFICLFVCVVLTSYLATFFFFYILVLRVYSIVYINLLLFFSSVLLSCIFLDYLLLLQREVLLLITIIIINHFQY